MLYPLSYEGGAGESVSTLGGVFRRPAAHATDDCPPLGLRLPRINDQRTFLEDVVSLAVWRRSARMGVQR